MKTTHVFGALMLLGAGVAPSVQAAPIDLTGPFNQYMTYGNLNSYSMPVLAGIYDGIYGTGTGPGNPYYVPSSPGHIQDLVVIYTGASGTAVTTNAAGFEDAYQTPSGSHPEYASTVGATNVVDPGSKAGIANPTGNTWDASLLALKGFLDGGDALFMFNNNDSNTDQSLAIWAKLWLTDANNGLYDNRYLYLSNENALYGLGGALNGDATTYNPGLVEPQINNATGQTDYVMSGGEVCFNASWVPQACDGSEVHRINHNLGANQVAYGGMVPVLNGWLDSLFSLSDAALDQYTLHLDLRLGCAPAWQNPATPDSGHNAVDDCANIKIDNGYEQLFLTSTVKGVVPEPATIALIGLGLLGLGLAPYRRRLCLA